MELHIIYSYIYIYKVNHFAAQQKLTQHCNQLYFNKINSENGKQDKNRYYYSPSVL